MEIAYSCYMCPVASFSVFNYTQGCNSTLFVILSVTSEQCAVVATKKRKKKKKTKCQTEDQGHNQSCIITITKLTWALKKIKQSPCTPSSIWSFGNEMNGVWTHLHAVSLQLRALGGWAAKGEPINRYKGSHYGQNSGHVPEYISLLFNFISNLFIPEMMWRSPSSSQVTVTAPKCVPPFVN